MPREVGVRSYAFGLHNPILHTPLLVLAWKLIFDKWPSFKEFCCILFHDIGYLVIKNGLDVAGDDHPVLGAKICGRLFGRQYYRLCIAHSRDFAKANGLELSRLGYVDKFWPFLLPSRLFAIIIRIGGEAGWYEKVNRNDASPRWGMPIQVSAIKREYHNWWLANWKTRTGN